MRRVTNLFVGYPAARQRGEAASLPELLDQIRDPIQREQARRFALGARHPQDIPTGEQLALLTLRRSELSRAIVEKLKRSTVRASQLDYWNLVHAGWAMRHARGFLHLTPIGRMKADALARDAAKKLDLHFFFFGATRLHNTIRCTCGWSHHFTAPSHHVASVNAQWMARHLREVGQPDAETLEHAPNVYGDEIEERL